MIQTSATANEIVNAVAAEVGLTPVVDAYASTDANFVQLQYLLNAAIRQLARNTEADWSFLVKEHIINTTQGETGEYPLPDDFLRMINQTGWERTNRNPMGTLSAQEWQYLKGRDLVSETIYVNFRIQKGLFTIYPTPVNGEFELAFEYISQNCVVSSSSGTNVSSVSTGADVPLFDAYLLERALKVKWYEAKGFDTTAAQDDLNEAFASLVSVDKSAPILNAGRRGYGSTRLLTGCNTSDTNFGNP